MAEVSPVRSIQGFPKNFTSSVRYEGKDLMLEDGDLAFIDDGLALIEGPAGVGQSIALSLASYFADLYDPEGFVEHVQHQEISQSSIFQDPLEGFAKPTFWEIEHQPELKMRDPRGMSIQQRIEAAVDEVSTYLDCVLDVRFNEHDIEIDYQPNGYDVHVLRLDGLIPRPGEVGFNWKRALPIHRESLLKVEDLTPRLVAYLKQYPEDLHQILWRTFERLIAELLESEGWDVLELTRGSKDEGVDIFAALPTPNGSILAVIDCKHYGDKIGVDKVRSIAGLKLQHDAEVGMIITTSYFTKGARNLERNSKLRNHVQLHDFDRVKAWLENHQWKSNSGLYLPKSRFSSDKK